MKICKNCQKEFQEISFRQKYCSKECRKIIIRQCITNYQIKNKDKISKYNQKYNQKVKENKQKTPRKCRYCNNLFVNKNLMIRFCSDNCKNIFQKENTNKWYKKNYNFIKQRRLRNLPRRREMARLRRQTDLNYKIANVIRTRVACVLKGKYKSQHTLDLLSCTVDFLKRYLESKFKPGMTWENYGLYTWHIDHIKPCASFDLSDPEQQKQCFHYTNLQPLWATENLLKGRKIYSIYTYFNYFCK